MKIRNGYVTNSSSTSFLLSPKKEWGKETFLTAVGADGDSPMNQVFEDLFEAIDSQKREIHIAMKEMGESDEMYEPESTISGFLNQMGFDPETIEVVEKFIAEGRTVFYGKLHTASEKTSEAYFCCRSFVVCEEDIYFNGSIGGW